MIDDFVQLLESGDSAHLAGLGDSLTHGYMVTRGYFDMVADGLRDRHPDARLVVSNHGVCGDTATGGLRRLGPVLRPVPPDLTLVQFGLNDCFMGIPAEEFQEDLMDLLLALQRDAPGSDLLLVPPPLLRYEEDNRTVKPYRRTFLKAAKETESTVAPVEKTWRTHEPAGPLWLSDGVHPSEEGYTIMARAVLAAILD